jgi:sulfatase modifying factor 1
MRAMRLDAACRSTVLAGWSSRLLALALFGAGCESAATVWPMPMEESPADSPDAAVVEDAAALADLAAACPADMVRFAGFCMDRYEAPNQAGAPPLAMRNALDGVAFCEARGKRLCSEAEWVRACQGPAGLPFPYGPTYQRSRCNDDKTWKSPNWTVLGTWPSAEAQAEAMRLYQADPSGSRGGCASAEGVHDLTGNVAEWVARSFPNSKNYDHVMKGCYWAGCYGGSPPSCAFVNPAHPGGFRSYEAGFRCCLSLPET